MRYPAAETAEKHTRILQEASRLFREHGFSGVSLGEIMKATGLTHGPFYNHFSSKEALMAESIEYAMNASLEGLEEAGESPEIDAARLERYLSPYHRDNPGKGCVMAALASEIGRVPAVQGPFTKQLKAVIEKMTTHLPWRSKRTARADSIRRLSALVGAVILSRAVNDEALSEEILREVRQGFQ